MSYADILKKSLIKKEEIRVKPLAEEIIVKPLSEVAAVLCGCQDCLFYKTSKKDGDFNKLLNINYNKIEEDYSRLFKKNRTTFSDCCGYFLPRISDYIINTHLTHDTFCFKCGTARRDMDGGECGFERCDRLCAKRYRDHVLQFLKHIAFN